MVTRRELSFVFNTVNRGEDGGFFIGWVRLCQGNGRIVETARRQSS
ncbi:MAG: hypothetical protein ABFC57_10515 [Veillonellales bacterium]